MKFQNEFLNECPKCGSFDTELLSDDYITLCNGKLNGFEELRRCNACDTEYRNAYAMVEHEPTC